MNAKTHISTPALVFNYDMSACPVGVKCLLLNMGDVCVFGPITNATRFHFKAWSPMPSRDKEEEKRRGYI
jgi:hypothetical protein